MKKNPFDNLPILSKEEAFNILSKRTDELTRSSDYYKAAFHLFKYPGPDTQKVLLKLVESESEAHCVVIARRKAIEVLARHKCVSAIPAIGRCLKSPDPYLVENAAWALQELDCNDSGLIQLMADLLDDSKQNRRVLIQALGNLGAVSQLPRIELFLKGSCVSPGILGASIAAVKRLSGASNQVEELIKLLSLPNQNDRQCAVNDIIDFGDIQLLPYILKTPVAPSFRVRAVNLLWPKNIENTNGIDLLNTIDSLILDDPNYFDLPNNCEIFYDEELLVLELLNTDYKRSYLALKVLLQKDPNNLWPILSRHISRMKRDYGALYFLMILFRSLKGWNHLALIEIKEITLFCLGQNWPDFMKFKPAAILTLAKLFPSIAVKHTVSWLDASITPFWVSRYAALMAIQKYPVTGIDQKIKDQILISRNDSNRFIKLKAEEISSKYSSENLSLG
ncbi:HEAT repeat domain-containing protein [Prochlorococcus sp. MIT 1307]|uniref:HEAT repeat domain-containing protein n=1 Tax=Prochlorococcus sp. MIT 1307 TaxID=3096219 RepID=UPI002A75D2C6|nr:HEAT repeat domain-containing protein [Prochlorococcus sp. MIT 1307]